ncbi:hypothetical protein MLD38_023148 [Melastoma candidum]|uniref:Uncharacterized protein n=1 Tax=Melastoma candidum TaxID=119954 RepID=A0ACB9QKX0_9MYRT|nr:hypothetical protein MLD38_023148 [Melastoma candidum]
MKPPPRARERRKAAFHGTGPSCSSSSPRCLEFFKVFIPSFSSRQLRVPPDFVKQCEIIPRKVILRELSGRSWNVGLLENAGGLFIKNGWSEFVKDNDLQFGDCLLFEYDMSSVFHIKIFGRNGCRKDGRGLARKRKQDSLTLGGAPDSANTPLMPKHWAPCVS